MTGGRTPVDFGRQRLRSRVEAAVLDAGAGQIHAEFGARKRAAIGSMTGTVVELGAGTGVNMRYYADGVHVIAIEPNPAMHDRLRAAADRSGVDLEIRTLRGESIDVESGSVDGVVGTLLLCGVEDPEQVVGEAHRVLRAGGTYFFLEHVAAPRGSTGRRAQDVLMRPHRWMFNGCEVNRDTAEVLRSSPFADVRIEEVVGPVATLYLRHRIVGTATK